MSVLVTLAAACGGGGISPDRFTESVTDDADDPAIWVHPTDPSRSLIVGTNKVMAPNGALVVFGLDGKTRQTISGIDRPNNVDIETGINLDGGDGTGGVKGTMVRRFGDFSEMAAEPGGFGEIEAMVVDDALGYVYCFDERFGIHKRHADPDHADPGRELAVFGLEGYQMDREGLGLYTRSDGTGFLVSTDQVPNGSIYKLYRREGEPGAPHRHVVIAERVTTVDETDGLEVTSTPLPGFPSGLVVAMNSGSWNLALFSGDRLFSGLK